MFCHEVEEKPEYCDCHYLVFLCSSCLETGLIDQEFVKCLYVITHYSYLPKYYVLKCLQQSGVKVIINTYWWYASAS